MMFLFFFFQAEDGIRDYKVTGVQTCALPIYRDPADVRERVAVGPEAYVQAERPEAHAPTPAELHLLALIARHATAHDEQAHALLAAHVNHRAPPAVEDVRAEGGAVVEHVGDVG